MPEEQVVWIEKRRKRVDEVQNKRALFENPQIIQKTFSFWQVFQRGKIEEGKS